MNITLHQKDIEQAIRSHIAGQGINLSNKDVAIKFNLGRKGNGLLTNVSISDSGIPGYSNVGSSVTAEAKDAIAVKGNKSDTKSVTAVVKAAKINTETVQAADVLKEDDAEKQVGFKDINQALLVSGGATPASTLPPVAAVVVDETAVAPTIGSTVQDDDAALVAAVDPVVESKVVEAATPVPAEEVQAAKAEPVAETPAPEAKKATTSLFG